MSAGAKSLTKDIGRLERFHRRCSGFGGRTCPRQAWAWHPTRYSESGSALVRPNVEPGGGGARLAPGRMDVPEPGLRSKPPTFPGGHALADARRAGFQMEVVPAASANPASPGVVNSKLPAASTWATFTAG